MQNIKQKGKKPKKKQNQKMNQIIKKLDKVSTKENALIKTFKNSKMTKYSRLSKRNLMNRFQSFQMSYARSIVLPEFSRGARLPSIFPQPTATMHKHITVPITTSVNGKAAILWQPYVLQESNSTPFSGLYLNNSATLTLTSAEATTGYQVLPTPWSVPANTFSSYRLVSASIRIDPQMSIQTAQGSVAGGIAVYSNQKGFDQVGINVFPFAGELTIAANVDNLLYFNKANITEQQAIRHIFFPLDPTYEYYTPVNYPHGTSATTNEINTEFYFAYYITGAPASSSFNIELYMNFECIPTPIAEGFIQMSPYLGSEDSNKIVKSVTSKPGVITQASPLITELLLEEDNDFSRDVKGDSRFAGKNESSFFNDISSFISDHGATIGGVAKGLMQFI